MRGNLGFGEGWWFLLKGKFGKNRKDSNEAIICSGIMLADEFSAQTEPRIYTLVIKAFIVYFLVGGALGGFLSSFEVEYMDLAVQLVVLISALYCASLFYRKIWQNIGYILLLIFIIFFAITFQRYINSGFYAVLNDFSEEASEYFNLNSTKSYGEQISNRYLAITVAMSFIGMVAVVIANIIVSRKMRIFPLFIIGALVYFFPMYMEKEPNLYSKVLFIAGLLMVYAWKSLGGYNIRMDNVKYTISKKRLNRVYDSKLFLQCFVYLTALVSLVVLAVSAVFPMSRYEKLYSDSSLKLKGKDTIGNLTVLGINGLFNYYPSTGGMNSGRLGGIGSVIIDYNPDLHVSFTPYTKERIYLKTFTGCTYQPFENRWNRNYGEIDVDSMANYCFEGARLSTAYLQGMEYTAKGVMEVKNIAAPSGYYAPYYVRRFGEEILPGNTVSYTYYPRLSYKDENENTVEPKEVWKDLREDYTYIWLEVPEENKQVIEDFCDEAGLTGTPEEIVSKLAAYYQEEIPYTLRPGTTPYGQDFINTFLTMNRKGFCAHFASAATLIFRNMGIPARYVEGYAIDYSEINESAAINGLKEYSEYYDGYSEIGKTAVIELDVTDADAHAWVEVYIKGKGWLPVEVTPYSEESPELGFLAGLFSLLRGNTLGGTDAAGRQAAGQAEETAEDVIGKASQGNLFAAIIPVFIFIIIVFICIFFRRRIAGAFNYHYVYRHGNRSDRLILFYTKKIRRLEREPVYKKIRNKDNGVSGAGDRAGRNYFEQMEWLKSMGYLTASEEDRKRFLNILERAGYASTEISEEEYKWVVELLEGIHR